MAASNDLPVKRFTSVAAWQRWLARQHDTSKGVWLEFARKDSGLRSLTRPEALEVALCYGWIDGQALSVDAERGRQQGDQMITLRIEHPVPDFEAWKRAFDQDPVGRRQGGVRRYRLWRSHADPGYVIVELDFDDVARAEAFHQRLRILWKAVEGKVMRGPTVLLMDGVEMAED